MSAKHLLFVGAASKKPTPVDPVIPPRNDEPYRVVWDLITIANNLPKHVVPLADAGKWKSSIVNTAVLTDYAEPVPTPAIKHLQPDPIATYFSTKAIKVTTPIAGGQGMRIDNILPIAHPDRRNRDPKVFFMRIGTGRPFDEKFILKYNLDDTGTKYVGIKAYRNNQQILAQLVMCLDGTNVQASVGVVVGDFSSATEITELRLVIFDDRIELHLSEPGTVEGTINLPAPLTARKSAHVIIFEEPAGYDGSDNNEGLFLRAFNIYDGNY